MVATTISLRKVKLKIEIHYQGLKLRTASLDAATILRMLMATQRHQTAIAV
jgi:hypothetical protein